MKRTCLSGNCLCRGPGEPQVAQPGESMISISIKMQCASRRAPRGEWPHLLRPRRAAEDRCLLNICRGSRADVNRSKSLPKAVIFLATEHLRLLAVREGECSGITLSLRWRKQVDKPPSVCLQGPVRPWLPESPGRVCFSHPQWQSARGLPLSCFPSRPCFLPDSSRVFPGITVQTKRAHLGASVRGKANQEKRQRGARPAGRLRSSRFSEVTRKHRGERGESDEPVCLHTS